MTKPLFQGLRLPPYAMEKLRLFFIKQCFSFKKKKKSK